MYIESEVTSFILQNNQSTFLLLTCAYRGFNIGATTTMASSQRFFVDGEQTINECVVNIVRFVPAQQLGENSRVAAKHWGTITFPDGRVETLGENGKTTRQIKAMIGLEPTIKTGESQDLRRLKNVREFMVSQSLDTTEIDAVIAILQAEHDAKVAAKEERKRLNSPEVKWAKRQLSALYKSRDVLSSCGLDVTEAETKIREIENFLENR